jgi:hypothetical protein
MPTILSLIDSDEEHYVGQLVRSSRSGVNETLDAAFHATLSFSVRVM